MHSHTRITFFYGTCWKDIVIIVKEYCRTPACGCRLLISVSLRNLWCWCETDSKHGLRASATVTGVSEWVYVCKRKQRRGGLWELPAVTVKPPFYTGSPPKERSLGPRLPKLLTWASIPNYRTQTHARTNMNARVGAKCPDSTALWRMYCYTNKQHRNSVLIKSRLHYYRVFCQ